MIPIFYRSIDWKLVFICMINVINFFNNKLFFANINLEFQLFDNPISAFSSIPAPIIPSIPGTSASVAHFPVHGDRLNNLRSTLRWVYTYQVGCEWLGVCALIVEYIELR